MGALQEAVHNLEQTLRCPLCGKHFTDPHTFGGCGCTFCYACVISRLEGPGISTSECPQCHKPGWKNDLHRNHALRNSVEHTAGLAEAVNRRQSLRLRAMGQGAGPGPAVRGQQERHEREERQQLPSAHACQQQQPQLVGAPSAVAAARVFSGRASSGSRLPASGAWRDKSAAAAAAAAAAARPPSGRRRSSKPRRRGRSVPEEEEEQQQLQQHQQQEQEQQQHQQQEQQEAEQVDFAALQQQKLSTGQRQHPQQQAAGGALAAGAAAAAEAAAVAPPAAAAGEPAAENAWEHPGPVQAPAGGADTDAEAPSSPDPPLYDSDWERRMLARPPPSGPDERAALDEEIVLLKQLVVLCEIIPLKDGSMFKPKGELAAAAAYYTADVRRPLLPLQQQCRAQPRQAAEGSAAAPVQPAAAQLQVDGADGRPCEEVLMVPDSDPDPEAASLPLPAAIAAAAAEAGLGAAGARPPVAAAAAGPAAAACAGAPVLGLQQNAAAAPAAEQQVQQRQGQPGQPGQPGQQPQQDMVQDARRQTAPLQREQQPVDVVVGGEFDEEEEEEEEEESPRMSGRKRRKGFSGRSGQQLARHAAAVASGARASTRAGQPASRLQPPHPQQDAAAAHAAGFSAPGPAAPPEALPAVFAAAGNGSDEEEDAFKQQPPRMGRSIGSGGQQHRGPAGAAGQPHSRPPRNLHEQRLHRLAREFEQAEAAFAPAPCMQQGQPAQQQQQHKQAQPAPPEQQQAQPAPPEQQQAQPASSEQRQQQHCQQRQRQQSPTDEPRQQQAVPAGGLWQQQQQQRRRRQQQELPADKAVPAQPPRQGQQKQRQAPLPTTAEQLRCGQAVEVMWAAGTGSDCDCGSDGGSGASSPLVPFHGRVVAIRKDASSGRVEHEVRYLDGDQQWHWMEEEQWRALSEAEFLQAAHQYSQRSEESGQAAQQGSQHSAGSVRAADGAGSGSGSGSGDATWGSGDSSPGGIQRNGGGGGGAAASDAPGSASQGTAADEEGAEAEAGAVLSSLAAALPAEAGSDAPTYADTAMAVAMASPVSAPAAAAAAAAVPLAAAAAAAAAGPDPYVFLSNTEAPADPVLTRGLLQLPAKQEQQQQQQQQRKRVPQLPLARRPLRPPPKFRQPPDRQQPQQHQRPQQPKQLEETQMPEWLHALPAADSGLPRQQSAPAAATAEAAADGQQRFRRKRKGPETKPGEQVAGGATAAAGGGNGSSSSRHGIRGTDAVVGAAEGAAAQSSQDAAGALLGMLQGPLGQPAAAGGHCMAGRAAPAPPLQQQQPPLRPTSRRNEAAAAAAAADSVPASPGLESASQLFAGLPPEVGRQPEQQWRCGPQTTACTAAARPAAPTAHAAQRAPVLQDPGLFSSGSQDVPGWPGAAPGAGAGAGATGGSGGGGRGAWESSQPQPQPQLPDLFRGATLPSQAPHWQQADSSGEVEVLDGGEGSEAEGPRPPAAAAVGGSSRSGAAEAGGGGPLQAPCIVISNSSSEFQQKVLRLQQLVPEVVIEEQVSGRTTHVLVKVDSHGRIPRRTMQYLLALAHGCWVLSHEWVDACLEAGGWVGERNYQAQGNDEGRHAPAMSRQRHHGPGAGPGLFAGRRVHLATDARQAGSGPAARARANQAALTQAMVAAEGGSLAARAGPAGPGSPSPEGGTLLVWVSSTAVAALEAAAKQAQRRYPGRPVVHCSWVYDSLCQGRCLDTAPYIMTERQPVPLAVLQLTQGGGGLGISQLGA